MIRRALAELLASLAGTLMGHAVRLAGPCAAPVAPVERASAWPVIEPGMLPLRAVYVELGEEHPASLEALRRARCWTPQRARLGGGVLC